MRLEGEKLDELLSGYLDDQLDQAELLVVRRALESDPSLRARLEELEQLSSEVKRLRLENRTQRLPVNFSKTVVAEARRRAAAEGLPDQHHVRRGAGHVLVQPDAPTWRLPAGIFGAIAAVAALFLISFWLPEQPIDEPVAPDGILADNNPSPPSVPTLGERADEEVLGLGQQSIEQQSKEQYVSELKETEVAFVTVVDMELSKEAWENEFLAEVFARSNVSLEAPIVADQDLQAELSKARMIVHPEDEQAEGEVQIYFIHADDAAIAMSLDILYRDLTNVPTFRLGLVFDNPLNSITHRIAKSSGKRFSMKDSIAAPVTLDATPGLSPFSGIGPQGMLVSSEKRLGPGEKVNLAHVTDGESTVLMLLRRPK
jgi:hypothetical protein